LCLLGISDACIPQEHLPLPEKAEEKREGKKKRGKGRKVFCLCVFSSVSKIRT
jgi:hypothetical protein